MNEKNPPWTLQETIVLLDFYMDHRPNIPPKGSPEIIQMSSFLNHLNDADKVNKNFRNPDGVYMKLMNIKSCDRDYEGGLGHTQKMIDEVFAIFRGRRDQLKKIAKAIKDSS